MKLIKGLLALLFVCGVVVADQQPMPKDKCGCQKPKPAVMPAKPRA